MKRTLSITMLDNLLSIKFVLEFFSSILSSFVHFSHLRFFLFDIQVFSSVISCKSAHFLHRIFLDS